MEEPDDVPLIINEENGRRSHDLYLTRVVPGDKPPNGQDSLREMQVPHANISRSPPGSADETGSLLAGSADSVHRPSKSCAVSSNAGSAPGSQTSAPAYTDATDCGTTPPAKSFPPFCPDTSLLPGSTHALPPKGYER